VHPCVPLQIAKLRGAQVIAVARGEKKLEVLQELGVDLVIDQGLVKSLKDAVKKFAPRGTDWARLVVRWTDG
jgi:NADPH-dependent curcumin reductase CurA